MIEMSEEEVQAAVRHIVAQKKVLDHEFKRVFFDGRAPQYWGDWPEWSRHLWDHWASVYKQVIREQKAAGTGRKRERDVSLAEAWEAIIASGREEPANRYTWRDLGDRLGISTRAAEYQLKQKHDFAIEGETGDRVLARAPCLDCAKQYAVGSLRSMRCRPCRRERKAA